jgi:hypothetical protein
MNALMTAIVLWLSANFGLPASFDHPKIEFVPAGKIVALRNKGLLDAARLEPGKGENSGLNSGQRDVVAVYETRTNTVYLREGWTGDTPAELSILVHEMVHHLQNVGGQKFDCPQAREQAAYDAQERWLNLFGQDLERDFAIDPFTLLVTTRCVF